MSMVIIRQHNRNHLDRIKMVRSHLLLPKLVVVALLLALRVPVVGVGNGVKIVGMVPVVEVVVKVNVSISEDLHHRIRGIRRDLQRIGMVVGKLRVLLVVRHQIVRDRLQVVQERKKIMMERKIKEEVVTDVER